MTKCLAMFFVLSLFASVAAQNAQQQAGATPVEFLIPVPVQQTNLALWLAFMGPISVGLLGLLQFYISKLADRRAVTAAIKADEVKTALEQVTQTQATGIAEIGLTLDKVHTLVDGQKSILLENIALLSDANVALVRVAIVSKTATDADLVRATEAARIARASADAHAAQIKEALAHGRTIIDDGTAKSFREVGSKE